MSIKQIVLLIFISIVAFGFINAADREHERESKIQTYYDGVFSGCIMVHIAPNMPDAALSGIEQLCTLKTNTAKQVGMMELYYKDLVPTPQIEDIIEY